MSVRFKWPPDLAAFQFGSALIWALRDGGISASISGISPLSLVNAIAKPITKLLQHGKVDVSGSTLTCNNGELVAVDDELPIGYKRITNIKFDGDFWYETNEILTGNDNVIMTLANTSSNGQNVFGSYNKTGTGVKNFSLYVYGGGSSSKSYFRYGEQLLRPQFGNGERTITFGKDGTSGFLSDVTVTPETFTTVATIYIGMLPNSSSPAYTGSIVGNILVGDRLKYIPCERVSDGIIGYYEIVNRVFLEPVGTGTPVKDDYDTSHCTIVSAEGTPEEIVVQGKNMMQPATSVTASEGITVSNNNGKLTINGQAASGKSVYVNFNPMIIQEGYIMAFMNSFINATVYFLNDNTQVDYFSASAVNRVVNAQSMTSIYGKQFNKLRILFSKDMTLSNENFSPMVVLDGEDTTTWQPYHHETAHAENLYAVGDIEDTQDIITGTVTRRTEAVVSDGTTPSGRYVGTVGEGNIIVKVKEDGYTGEIVSFDAEEETPLNGLIVEMEPQQDLHFDYQLVEYIESYKGQYIDTGIIPNQNTGFKITFYTKDQISGSYPDYGCVFGARVSSGVDELQITTYTAVPQTNGTLRFRNIPYEAGVVPLTKQTASLRNNVFIDASGVSRNVTTEAFSAGCSIYLFGLHQGSEPVAIQNGAVRIYDFELYSSDTLIMHLIPCYRKSDNEIGMLDIVGNKFYGNIGTGAFTKGDDISIPNPNCICPISGWAGCKVWRTGKNLFPCTDAVVNNHATIEQTSINDIPGYKITGEVGWRVQFKGLRENITPGMSAVIVLYSDFSSSFQLNFGNLLGQHKIAPSKITTVTQISSGLYMHKATIETYDATDACWNYTDQAVIPYGGNLTQADGIYTFSTPLYVRENETNYTYEPHQGNFYSVTFGALGKNLFNFKSDYSDWANGYIMQSGIPSGSTPTSPTYERTSPFIPIKGGVDYTVSYTPNTSSQLSNNCAFYDVDKNFIDGTFYGQYGVSQYTRTAPENAAFFRFSCRTYNSATNYQLEQSSSATAYEPYRDQVYGGNYDFVNGKGKDKMRNANMGEFGWFATTYAGATMMACSISAKARDRNDPVPALCSIYEASDDIWGASTLRDKIFSINYAGTVMYAYDSDYTDAAAFKAAVQGVQLVYEAATPSDFQREPQPISTLEDENNIWSNAGTVTAYVPTAELIEQVTPQQLSTAEGDNTITVTAEVDDIMFDVTYRENNPDG